MAALGVLALAQLAPLPHALGLQPRVQVDSQDPIEVVWDGEDGLQVISSNQRRSAMDDQTVAFSNGTSCLNFLQIPGAFVESSSTWATVRGGADDDSLQCRDMGHCPSNHPLFKGKERCCPMSDGSFCSVWHVPPAFDKRLQKSYSPKQCATFCVVRDPVSRFRNQYAWSALDDGNIQQSDCSTESLDKNVEYTMQKLKKTPYMADCQLVPQVWYYRAGRTCHHVIKQETFESDFAKLMDHYRISVKIQKNPKKNLETHCNATFSRWALDQIQTYYRQDYTVFNYMMQ